MKPRQTWSVPHQDKVGLNQNKAESQSIQQKCSHKTDPHNNLHLYRLKSKAEEHGWFSTSGHQISNYLPQKYSLIKVARWWERVVQAHFSSLIFFWILQPIFLTDFLSSLSLSLWTFLWFSICFRTSRREKRVFYIIRSCFIWGFPPTKDKDEVRQLVTCFSTPSSTSSWTFPFYEERYKQLKQTACDQHVTSNEQAGKQVG